MHEDFIKRHDFDPVKKITNIECFIKEDEGYILQTKGVTGWLLCE